MIVTLPGKRGASAFTASILGASILGASILELGLDLWRFHLTASTLGASGFGEVSS
jgi:hypothetical protein